MCFILISELAREKLPGRLASPSDSQSAASVWIQCTQKFLKCPQLTVIIIGSNCMMFTFELKYVQLVSQILGLIFVVISVVS